MTAKSAAADDSTGSVLPNVDQFSMVFTHQGSTWEQRLYPAPVDGDALKTALIAIPGVESVTINSNPHHKNPGPGS